MVVPVSPETRFEDPPPAEDMSVTIVPHGFEGVIKSQDGAPRLEATVVVDGNEGKMFMRNALRQATGQHVRWLVMEMHGVKVYVCGNRIVMTAKDLWP